MHTIGKKVGILNIGSELLVGHTLNTHASFLSNELNALGYSVYSHVSVGDNPERIKDALDYLSKTNDLIICTGGLGPTLDDISRNVVADFLGLKLIEDEKVMADMKASFQRKNIEYTENNASQAFFPEGATVLPNPLGTAPGFIAGNEDLTIICLPGPPRELKAVMKPLIGILEQGEKHLFNKFIHIFGLGESTCADKIEDIFDEQTDPSIGIYASPGLIKLRLSTMKKSEEEAEKVFQPVVESLKSRIGDYIFSYDGEDLNEKLLRLLVEKGLKIAFAESCTGGLAAKFLTDLNGSSQVFDLGVITYSNDQKRDRLGLSENILESCGAVSEKCVLAMNEGIYKLSKADVCVAISGVAGKGGGTEKTPVGTVFIAVMYKGQNIAKSYSLIGGRDIVRTKTVRRAFFDVINRITSD